MKMHLNLPVLAALCLAFSVEARVRVCIRLGLFTTKTKTPFLTWARIAISMAFAGTYPTKELYNTWPR